MKALYYNGVDGVEWREDAPPRIELPTDALVRPIAVTTCDLDQAILRGGVPGSEVPFAIGHEGVGEVVQIGDGVEGIVPGDVVVVPYHVSCGDRRLRRRGRRSRSATTSPTPGVRSPRTCWSVPALMCW